MARVFPVPFNSMPEAGTSLVFDDRAVTRSFEAPVSLSLTLNFNVGVARPRPIDWSAIVEIVGTELTVTLNEVLVLA